MKSGRYIGILLLAALFTLAALPSSAGDRDANKKELERIKQEMESEQQKLQQAGKKERSILSQLEKIDREIQTGSAELAEHQKKLQEAEAALAEITQSNAVTAQDLERLRMAYAARIRALYKMQRSGGYTLAVLSSENFDTAYQRLRYLGIIARRDQKVIRDYQDNLARLALREQEIKDRRSEIITRTVDVESKRASLEVRKRKKNELLSSIKKEKGAYEATLKDLEDASANLWAMIRLGEQEKRPAAKSVAAGRERLPWPVNGQVLTRFGSQKHPKFGTIVFRRGIEIAANTGDEVKAVDNGQVVYADWYKGYGVLVIIEHKDAGLYTLYGHLSKLNVQSGDQITRGQVVGLAGDTGSLKGSKLYFELRRNGEAEDPLEWLAKR